MHCERNEQYIMQQGEMQQERGKRRHFGQHAKGERALDSRERCGGGENSEKKSSYLFLLKKLSSVENPGTIFSRRV